MKTLLSTVVEHGRAAEWITSAVMLGFGLVLVLPGDTLAAPGFVIFRRLGLEEVSLAVPLTLVASGRMAALYINGRWEPGTPILRRWGAQIGSVLFAMLGMAFGWPYLEDLLAATVTLASGHGWPGLSIAPSTGAATYSILAMADILAVYRASVDKGRAVARVA